MCRTLKTKVRKVRKLKERTVQENTQHKIDVPTGKLNADVDDAATHASEKSKYESVWDIPNYRIHSPGEKSLDAFRGIVNPESGSTIVDFGNGCGRASLKLAELGYKVKMIDLTEKSMDEDVRLAVVNELHDMEFMEGSIWDITIPQDALSGNYGYCCDVMEHIPPKYVMQTLSNIMMRVEEGCFFFICLVPDSFGKVIGQPLHLTVRTFGWWKEHLSELGEVVEARDLLQNGLFYVKKKKGAE